MPNKPDAKPVKAPAKTKLIFSRIKSNPASGVSGKGAEGLEYNVSVLRKLAT